MVRQRAHREQGAGIVTRGAALVKAAHPGPCATVTGLAVWLGAAGGLSPAKLWTLGAAVLAGQLSIGWLNDLVDEAADRAAGRPDKPLISGLVSRRALRTAFLVSATACVPLSFALGAAPGAVHLLVVGSGWAYDLRLKRTVWSWAPYAVAFGALPAVVVLSLPGSPRPPWWACLAGALLGVGAHAANALPDIEADRRAQVGGLPARVGRSWTRLIAAGSLGLATVVLVVAPPGQPGAAAWLALVCAVLLLAVALGPTWTRWARLPFVLVAAAAIIDVVLLADRSGSWASGG
jgi:4-hydroxybenzoate polyprenyltransferase